MLRYVLFSEELTIVINIAFIFPLIVYILLLKNSFFSFFFFFFPTFSYYITIVFYLHWKQY
jgi:hypothetical protein